MLPIKLIFATALLGICAACAKPAPVTVAKPVVPTTESECIARGGYWTTLGLPSPGKPKMCDLKTTDSGKSCTDSSQCQGACLAPPDAITGTSMAGSCSPYVANFGNVSLVSNGKVEQVNVE